MPFLYLPDAISLALLLLALSMLRRSASLQFRQEMQRLQTELFEFCADGDFFSALPACGHLNSRIKSAIACIDEISPARLFLVARLLRKSLSQKYDSLVPEWFSGFESFVLAVPGRKERERLRRIEMEFKTSLGMYYMFASISGWILTATVVYRLTRRAFLRRSKYRVDWIFDGMERVFIHGGTRAHRLVLLRTNESWEAHRASVREDAPAG